MNRKPIVILLGMISSAVAMGLPALAEVRFVHGSPRADRVAAANAAREKEISAAGAGEKWVAGKAIVFDSATRQLRKPTSAETADMIRSLRLLTARPASIPTTVRANGVRQGAVEGRFANVVIARATEDGSVETICVQSFDEAVQFLGLELQKPEANQ